MMHEYIQLGLTAAAGMGTLISLYVALSLKAMRAQLSQQLAEQENRIFRRINGHYIRREECSLREDRLHDLIDSVRREGERDRTKYVKKADDLREDDDE